MPFAARSPATSEAARGPSDDSREQSIGLAAPLSGKGLSLPQTPPASRPIHPPAHQRMKVDRQQRRSWPQYSKKRLVLAAITASSTARS